MSADFDLIITADAENGRAELVLRDAAETFLASYETDFKTIAASEQRGLFDLRNYLSHYATDKDDQSRRMAEVGICIKERVLGADIFSYLWRSDAQRTLRIQLPRATATENQLAAALARVPWEIARPAVEQATLGERNLLVRVVHEGAAPPRQPLALSSGESLRVLFVFAQARGSQPLSARKERRVLLNLFKKEIYPQRRIEAHFLTHGVTRERLEEKIAENNGYHIVHWSGHGHLNLLELAKPGGRSDRLSGQELLALFRRAGGFLPHLFFLSACYSGDILQVKDWDDLLAALQGKEPGTKESTSTVSQELPPTEQPGYTGTAHALLEGGVPSVVAMRFAVGDEYARELSVEFYRALLAHAQPKNAAAALTMARNKLADTEHADRSHFMVCDHATPVLYGASDPGLQYPKGRSTASATKNPRLHQLPELTTTQHEHFVGRTWELADLGAEFIGASRSAEVKPIALITGLGGMGKTALVAEALALWESQFEWVALYQSKPNPLKLDRDFLWNLHMRLIDKSDAYRERITANSRDAIWLEADGDFKGARRLEVLLDNLIAVLRDHAILLVLDNFETNLKQSAQDPQAADPVWACQDTDWDRCLARLADELRESPSRVLLTCRRPLAALHGKACQRVLLGPLPPGEAALYLRDHKTLSQMFFSSDKAEQKLARRLLEATRFHPLLMDRLGRLANGGVAQREQLMQAIEAMEQSKDFNQLPDLFAKIPGDAQERSYLNDALAASLDQLIEHASPDARRLLWMIAVANEPVTLDLLHHAWNSGNRQLTTDNRQPITNLLHYLTAVGLVNVERDDAGDENPNLSCHELVRERIRARMEAQPQERDGMTENSIRLAYADQLIAAFNAFESENMTAALQVGSRALVYCVQAEAYDRLGEFASGVVTSSNDPRLLGALLPHLQAAAESAPAGQARWSCLCYLADALTRGGSPDAGLPFYEQAEALARHAATSAAPDSPDARQAWSSVGVITGNWAIALRVVGNLDAARQRQLESAATKKNAGSPAIEVIGSELEALRIEIMQGQVAAALPQVETRLQQIEGWWRQLRAGQSVPEAPDPAFLARAYIGALDITKDAHYAQQDWPAALPRIDAILEVKRALQRPAEDLADDRMNRAVVLTSLGRFGEAQAELEACLQVFQHDPARSARVLSSLANLFDEQGDVAEAIRQERRALALCERLPDPRDRAISHNNLSYYLERSGTSAALAEAPRHRLADLIYCIVAGLGQDMQTSLHNYAIRFRRAQDAGTSYAVPRVAEVVAAFASLDEWLRLRQVDVDELQAAVDEWLEQVRAAALEQPPEPS